MVTTETCQNQIATSGKRKETATIPAIKKYNTEHGTTFIMTVFQVLFYYHGALCASTFHIENR